MSAPGPILAVDVGGTKLSVGIVSTDGVLLDRHDTPTPLDDPFPALARLVDGTLGRDTSPVAVGAGCGGPMTPGGEEVSPLNIAAWRRFPLRRAIADHTGLPVFVDNDAKALARGEGWRGAAQGVDNYIGMVVSTGVGGGIVCDGRLLDGALGNAGHIGHVIVEPDGHMCGCGARGCVEAEASGSAIARITGRPPADAPPELRARSGRLVGRAIASVANLMDLQLAVVSGSVALGYGDAFFTAAQAEIDERCRLDFSRGTRVVPGALGADGPLIGAAAVALAHLSAEG